MPGRPRRPSLRRQGRALALQALYAMDLARRSPEESLEWLSQDRDTPPDAREFARSLVGDVASRRDDLDARIARHAPLFPVASLAAVDRAVLRLALAELLTRPDTPPKVVVNEAVELAKTYGSESSARFVNGVLGSALQEWEAGAPESGEEERSGGA